MLDLRKLTTFVSTGFLNEWTFFLNTEFSNGSLKFWLLRKFSVLTGKLCRKFSVLSGKLCRKFNVLPGRLCRKFSALSGKLCRKLSVLPGKLWRKFSVLTGELWFGLGESWTSQRRDKVYDQTITDVCGSCYMYQGVSCCLHFSYIFMLLLVKCTCPISFRTNVKCPTW